MRYKYKYVRILFIVFLILSWPHCSWSQADTLFARTSINLNQYLSLVGRQNLGYLAEQYNVTIAEAGIESAKVFPDPELAFSVYDNQQSVLHLGRGYNAGAGTTLELGGKRRARIGLARSQAELNRALLKDYFRNLRADAALAYYNALLQCCQLRVLHSSYHTLTQLAAADSVRLSSGAIAAIDARQSGLEAGAFFNAVLQGEADWKTSLVQLNLNAGRTDMDTLLLPSGDFEQLYRFFSLPELIEHASANRTDAIAMQNARKVADKTVSLARANRRIDLGVSAGFQYAGEATNEIAPTPAYRSISAGIAIPLKISNVYKGALKAAEYMVKQAEVQYRQILLQIQTEVTQAYLNYKAAGKQVEQYKAGLLSAAEQVLAAKIYTYKRGESSLLEVLNAQRTYNEVQQNYYQALYNHAAALIGLERSAGIWDID